MDPPSPDFPSTSGAARTVRETAVTWAPSRSSTPSDRSPAHHFGSSGSSPGSRPSASRIVTWRPAVGTPGQARNRTTAADTSRCEAIPQDRKYRVGAIGNLVEARDRRQRRMGAGRDTEPSREISRSPAIKRSGPVKGLSSNLANTQPFEAPSRIIWRKGRDRLFHMGPNARKIDSRRIILDAEGSAAPMLNGGARRRDQGPGRHRRY